ncbi:hypothetical protein C4J81_06835 [Deltaproteobacteria bacterium Smac51]|nr:hypothetical protein C4J81_06835 [Deltaproteobacteria bacterium Smac51]
MAAFVAATLLPAQSELALGALLLAGGQPVWALIAVASLGNILGSCVNWLLGAYFSHLRERKWFPIKAEALGKAESWYHRYGRWSLLLSWAPIIGDPLTLAAGLLREPFPSFLLIVTIAKTARYLAVAAAALSWGS